MAVILCFLLDLPAEAARALEAFEGRMAGAWGSLDMVQVRAKEAPAGPCVEAVEHVLRLVREEAGERPRLRRGSGGLEEERCASGGRGPAGVGRPLVLANDRADVALAAGADGVHVGAEDLSPEAVRRLDGAAGLVVGLTCHTLEELRRATRSGADYVGVGSFFASPTKPGPLPNPRRALRELRVPTPPMLAIGGLTLANLPEVLAEPRVAGVAVSSAIQRSDDPAAAARAWRARLDEASLRDDEASFTERRRLPPNRPTPPTS